MQDAHPSALVGVRQFIEGVPLSKFHVSQIETHVRVLHESSHWDSGIDEDTTSPACWRCTLYTWCSVTSLMDPRSSRLRTVAATAASTQSELIQQRSW